jgi:hypothetical protein
MSRSTTIHDLSPEKRRQLAFQEVEDAGFFLELLLITTRRLSALMIQEANAEMQSLLEARRNSILGLFSSIRKEAEKYLSAFEELNCSLVSEALQESFSCKS